MAETGGMAHREPEVSNVIHIYERTAFERSYSYNVQLLINNS